MRKAVFALIVAIITTPVRAADEGDGQANYLTRLYMAACIPNMGHPERVRAWAEDHHLQEITDPIPLSVFVGPGDGGAAWSVPTSIGAFAISIRGGSHACATYARQANPVLVESNFKTIVDGVKRPGIEVRVERDETVPTAYGKGRTLAYIVTLPDADKGFEQIMQTMEKPGGGFQAVLMLGGVMMNCRDQKQVHIPCPPR
jgi:hypothetical protein